MAARLRVGVGKRARVMDMVREIADLVPMREIKIAVCEALITRQWKNWTGANGETRRLWRPERDLVPTETSEGDR